MSSGLFIAGDLAFISPFLAIASMLVSCGFRRARLKRSKNRHTGSPVFYSSTAALGTILLFAQMFYRPSIAHIVEVRQLADADEDDAGEPATATRHLNRQLRQIRRGEVLERLVLRL
jgi:hypothetical protein